MAKCRGSQWQADFLKQLHCHQLLMLQEAGLSPVNLELFDDQESFEWQMARSFHIKRQSLDTGVKTGCRCASLESHCWQSPVHEPFVRTRKMILQTRYRLENGQELMVLNTHGVNFVRLRNFHGQLDQLARAAADHQGPLLLAGDFNTWRPARMKGLLQLSRDLGLTEVELSRSARPRHLKQHLDHLFVRGLKPAKAEVLDSIRSSDHYPISAQFSAEIPR